MTSIKCPECSINLTKKTNKCKHCGLPSMYCDFYIKHGKSQVFFDDFVVGLVRIKLERYNFNYEDAWKAILRNPDKQLSTNVYHRDYLNFVHECEDVREYGIRGKLTSLEIICACESIVDKHLGTKSVDYLEQWFGFYENDQRRG